LEEALDLSSDRILNEMIYIYNWVRLGFLLSSPFSAYKNMFVLFHSLHQTNLCSSLFLLSSMHPSTHLGLSVGGVMLSLSGC